MINVSVCSVCGQNLFLVFLLFLHDFSFFDFDDRLLLMTRHHEMDRSALYHKIEVPTCMRIYLMNDKTTLSNKYTNDINDNFFLKNSRR